jgi:GNAT superfamily N-acetyltransferase
MKKDEVAAGAGVIVYDWPSGPLDPEQSKRAYLLNVFTETKFRRLGLAKALTDVAMQWARSAGFKVLWLHASDFGRPLYEKLGFENTNEMKIKL